MQWAALKRGRHPELDALYAIPNGGDRDTRVAAALKREGVKAGMPDLCLPVPRHGYGALYIELKVDGGRVQPRQVEIHSMLEVHGNLVVVAWGADEAIAALEDYLRPQKISPTGKKDVAGGPRPA